MVESFSFKLRMLHDTGMIHSRYISDASCDGAIYLANIFRGRIEYELIYSLRGAKVTETKIAN